MCAAIEMHIGSRFNRHWWMLRRSFARGSLGHPQGDGGEPLHQSRSAWLPWRRHAHPRRLCLQRPHQQWRAQGICCATCFRHASLCRARKSRACRAEGASDRAPARGTRVSARPAQHHRGRGDAPAAVDARCRRAAIDAAPLCSIIGIRIAPSVESGRCRRSLRSVRSCCAQAIATICFMQGSTPR